MYLFQAPESVPSTFLSGIPDQPCCPQLVSVSSGLFPLSCLDAESLVSTGSLRLLSPVRIKKHEPSHEKKGLSIMRIKILQTHICSYSTGSDM